jgi:hypothetical protein
MHLSFFEIKGIENRFFFWVAYQGFDLITNKEKNNINQI